MERNYNINTHHFSGHFFQANQSLLVTALDSPSVFIRFGAGVNSARPWNYESE